MSNYVAFVLVAIGLLFNLFGCIGLVRLPDIYTRLQAATKCVTLGTCMVLVGVFAYAGFTSMGIKALVCMVFVLVTSPTAAHAIARGAYKSGVRMTEAVVDRYAEVADAGDAQGTKTGNAADSVQHVDGRS